MSISSKVRESVRKRANFICEYCHSSEEGSTGRFTMDHLLPRSLGGTDDEINLALACTRCNGRRYNFIDGIDPETQAIVYFLILDKMIGMTTLFGVGMDNTLLRRVRSDEQR